jgi:hypothetical protein
MAKLGISTGTVPNDGNGDSLLIGAIKINSNFNEIYNYFGDGTNLNFSNVDVWNRTGSGINTLSNVGIATTNPRFSLEVGSIGAAGTSLWVNGSARITGILTIGSSSITLNGSSNTINVGSGVTIYGNTGIISATDFYANGLRVGVISATTIVYQGGTLYNTWQQAASGIHTLSNVGIGTTNSLRALTVIGSGASLSQLYVTGVSTFVGVSTFATINAQTINVNTSGINVAANIPAYFGNTSDGYIAFLSGDNSFHIRTPGGVAPLVLGAGTVRITNGDASSEFARFTGIGLTVTGTTFTNQLRVSGVVTATSFVGDGSGLTGVVGSGSGVVIKDSGSTVGTAGTIDFGDNLTVSAVSAGVVTVTASGGGSSSQWVTTAAGIHTLSNVGVGTTNPRTPLQVENVYGIKTGFGTFTASAGIAYTADSFTISSTDFKTVEYTLHVGYGVTIQAQKVLAMQNGTNAYSQEYAIMYEPSAIVSVATTITSGEFRLHIIPEVGVNGLTTYRLTRQSML